MFNIVCKWFIVQKVHCNETSRYWIFSIQIQEMAQESWMPFQKDDCAGEPDTVELRFNEKLRSEFFVR